MDFSEAMRHQDARDRRQSQQAASREALERQIAELKAPEIRKAFYDLAQYLTTRGVPMFRFVDQPPKRAPTLKLKLKWNLTWDRTPSPEGFVLRRGIDRPSLHGYGGEDRLTQLTLLLPDGRLWEFERGDGRHREDRREFLNISAERVKFVLDNAHIIAGTNPYAKLRPFGWNILIERNGNLIAEHTNNDQQVSFMQHIAEHAKRVENQDISELAQFGITRAC